MMEELLVKIQNKVNDSSVFLKFTHLRLLLKEIKESKRKAVAANEQEYAKLLWCFQYIVNIQLRYVHAFNLLNSKRYYRAWCELEKIQIGLKALKKHLSITNNLCDLERIEKEVLQLQILFPYTLFVSHESIYLEKRCSICSEIISPRKSCGHIVGEIYNGEMCGRLITKAELKALAYTHNPVHKYAVCFFNSKEDKTFVDKYDYFLLEGFLKIINSPNDSWKLERKIMQIPHSDFTTIKPENYCPCGSSKSYGNCCLRNDYVKHTKYIVVKMEK